MKQLALSGWIGLLAAGLPFSAAGLVLCTVGFPCHPGGFDPPPILQPLPGPIVVVPGLEVLGIQLAAGDEGLIFNAPGDLILHVASGRLEALDLDLRAGGEVLLLDGLTLHAEGSIHLCGLAVCDAFVGDLLPGIAAQPFHVGVDGPLLGTLGLFAVGDLVVTTDPFPAVPEPRTGLLVVLGLLALAGRRASPRSR